MFIKMLHNDLLFWGEDWVLQIEVLNLPELPQRVIVKSDTANMPQALSTLTLCFTIQHPTEAGVKY